VGITPGWSLAFIGSATARGGPTWLRGQCRGTFDNETRRKPLAKEAGAVLLWSLIGSSFRINHLRYTRDARHGLRPRSWLVSVSRVAAAAPAASLCAGHVQQLEGESPSANLMEVKA